MAEGPRLATVIARRGGGRKRPTADQWGLERLNYDQKLCEGNPQPFEIRKAEVAFQNHKGKLGPVMRGYFWVGLGEKINSAEMRGGRGNGRSLHSKDSLVSFEKIF